MGNFKKCGKILIICLCWILKISGTWSMAAGGTPTTKSSVPYIVQIFISDRFVCGGTLIATNFVVTAAHCINNIDQNTITVKANISLLTEYGIGSAVSGVQVPTDYDASTHHKDVSVLKLSTPFTGVKTATTCSKPWQVGDAVNVYGWGATYFHGTYLPNQLQHIELKAMDLRLCATYFQTYNLVITTSMTCAVDAGKSPCEGDSGGPLIINGEFCGVVSWGIQCGKGSPGVFTSILNTQDFITEAVKSLKSSAA